MYRISIINDIKINPKLQYTAYSKTIRNIQYYHSKKPYLDQLFSLSTLPLDYLNICSKKQSSKYWPVED